MIDPSLLPALQSLFTVARTGSVGAAARQHHRTSSAISQQIRRLESHLGVKLLERAGRGVRLTPAGEAAVPAIGHLWSEAEALFDHLATLSGRPVTTVRVAVSDYLARRCSSRCCAGSSTIASPCGSRSRPPTRAMRSRAWRAGISSSAW